MNRRDALMLRNRSAQVATHYVNLVFGIGIAKVTPLAGVRGVFLWIVVFQVID